jgi:superfamily I DNA/RNA helicase
MSTWLVSRDELTPDQLRAIELDAQANKVIVGGPGSGKTQILIYRADHLRRILKTPPDRFHIFVYTKVLNSYIQSALDLLDLPAECTSTLDGWAHKFYQQHISPRAPWSDQRRSPDFDAIRRAVLDRLNRTGSAGRPYEFILVDEGQDLNRDSLLLIRAMARHVTICADHKQQIYDDGSTERDICDALGVRGSSVAFLDAFRCCPYVSQLASAYIDDASERDAYRRQIRTSQSERETPLLYRASNFEDEKRRLIEIVKVRSSRNERIGILFPQRRQVFGFAQGLRESGLDVETPESGWHGASVRASLDFSSDRPKLLPYHSAKGLTFDTVIMPRLLTGSFRHMSQERIRRILFVGISRATGWVYLSTERQDGFEPLQLLDPLGQRGVLTIQEGTSSHAGATAGRSQTTSDSDPLDIL